MKKILIKSLIFIILGFIIGNFIFSNKKEIIKSISKSSNYYFIQEGIYKDEDSIKKNLSTIPKKVLEIENDEYYVYLGITKDYEIAKRIMSIYNKKGYKVYLKRKRVLSPIFLNNIKQFDSLIKKTAEEDKILTIEEIVLENYLKIKNKS